MKRAPKGLGSVSPLQNGRWLVKVPVGKTAQGATRYKSKIVGTKSEAKKWQNKFIALREQQQLVADPRVTLKDYALGLSGCRSSSLIEIFLMRRSTGQRPGLPITP